MSSLEDSDTMWPENVDPSYQIPNEIDVAVYDGPEYYEFPVQIEVAYSNKPYIGGYRNKNTGKHYHHAITQTDESACFEKFKKTVFRDTSKQLTRETQTQDLRNHSAQCYRECGTQMERSDLKPDIMHDKYLECKTYLTAAELMAIKISKAILIQSQWRIVGAKMLIQRIRQQNQEREQAEREAEEKEKARRLAIEEYERQRRMNPKTRDDFNILHQELDIMHKQDIERIKAELLSKDQTNRNNNTKNNTANNNNMDGTAGNGGNGDELNNSNNNKNMMMTSALKQLLEEESQRIAEIDRVRVLARRDAKSEWVRRDLEKMASPLSWSLTGQLKGDTCVIETPQSTRANQLLQLYTALEAPVTSAQDRLNLLSEVQHVITGEDSRLLRDIYELVGREMDLLSRGRSAHMIQLRLRLQHLLISYIQDPVYNPAAGLPERRVKKGLMP